MEETDLDYDPYIARHLSLFPYSSMSNTYSQIHLHIVFAVQNRLSLIRPEWKNRLYQYIVSIAQNHGHKVLSIGGMPDHIHVLLGLRPEQSISELVRIIKRDSSIWINQNHLVQGHFKWQEGYGVFSYSKSQMKAVINYIDNQELHHQKYSFIEEYRKTLDVFGITYDERYLFKELE